MRPGETARLLAFVDVACPSPRGRAASTAAWHLLLADLDAADARAAVIRLARRQCDLTPDEVRAEVRAMRGQRPARTPSARTAGGTDDPYRARALRAPCPWCGAARGEPCTVPGSDTPLRKSPAHPARLAVTGGAVPAGRRPPRLSPSEGRPQVS